MMRMQKCFSAYCFLILVLSSCSVSNHISKSAKEVINSKALQSAHVGISIYDPSINKYLYNYQGDKYFVPASNTKIPTCYAAMKYLGDSLVGLRYTNDPEYIQQQLIPTGDPTFLHPDFPHQPVYTFLKNSGRIFLIRGNHWRTTGLGSGWAWNDYSESYMAERSPFPVYGNLVHFSKKGQGIRFIPQYGIHIGMLGLVKDTLSLLDTSIRQYYIDSLPENFSIHRFKDANFFEFNRSNTKFNRQAIPFIPADSVIIGILKDTIKGLQVDGFYDSRTPLRGLTAIHSQPTDSVLKPMMHRSDNFFAEQTLLMVSNERLGYMDEDRIIDTILKTDFKDLPQRPRWADGSGLSRYNLFTPQDFVTILDKMKNEFGMDRVREIFPTGGEGTISNYYKADSGYIFGKTGTLSGVVAFSGFLYTQKGRILIFSTLVNNHQGNVTEIRRSVEKLLQQIRKEF
jgi:serine-type D-Ala-D-Ala carboxypeptidase/endopeptidase (penicillin-binding protein 4)